MGSTIGAEDSGESSIVEGASLMGFMIGAEDSGESPIADGASILSSTTDAECSDEIPIIKDATIDAKGGAETAAAIGRTMGPTAIKFAFSSFLCRGCRREHTNRGLDIWCQGCR